MATLNYATPHTQDRTFLGHPVGLFLLFLVEMWERFSYYGMRALLVLYLVRAADAPNPGRGWTDARASTLFGWYTGLAYLLPIFGGIIADKLIGTHRSMVVGGLIIALGHIALAISGMGSLGHTDLGMSIFIMGLALIVLGTGHFKPTVSVMVGQLYAPGDPRRDGAFSIFYMGINLGAFLCAFVCGTLGEKQGWHWGFGAAAVGMLAGLFLYLIGRPLYLRGIGEAPAGRANVAPLFVLLSIVLAAGFAVLFHRGALSCVQEIMRKEVAIGLGIVIVGLAAWFVAIQQPDDRGPVSAIFLFMFFNAFFWVAFEQAGSSINLFTDRFTDRTLSLAPWYVSFCTTPSMSLGAVIFLVGLIAAGWFAFVIVSQNAAGRFGRAVGALGVFLLGLGVAAIGVLKAFGWLSWAAMHEVPTTWFQSVNPLFIIMLAPVFGGVWTILARRKLNPSQPVKIALGLIFLGLGYVVITWGALAVEAGSPETALAKTSMLVIVATYALHTIGELCLSPTGLSFVTRVAPVRFVSLLMGIWFISSFIANLSGGLIAAKVEAIEKGTLSLPWYQWFKLGGQADFFLLFVISSLGAGLLILILTPLLKRLLHGRE